MPNPVLDRFRSERADQLANMDTLLNNVEDRDLVDAERAVLVACQERIAQLDAQIEPLANLETMRDAHRETVGALPRPADHATPRRAELDQRGYEYRSVGGFLVDYVRANGILDRNVRDEQAASRLYQARADQTTADTPGLLPTPLIGPVVNLIDSNRPLIASLGGARGLGGIPGTTFGRPRIATHTQTGKQTAEKTALASRKMSITSTTFTKETHGGYVDISRQDIDWTSPSAWDILVRDLADEYAIETETVIAADFAAKALGTKPPALPASPVLADMSKALYTAAMHSYQAAQRMPDRIWCSLDAWAFLGSMVDVARIVLPTSGNLDTAAGSSSLADFRGDILGLPRVVVPFLPAKTLIVGPSSLYEVYEDTIGLLSVIEPSILGVQVAYGGYLAFGTLAQTAFVPLDLSAVTVLPTMAETDAVEAEADTSSTSKSSK